MDDFWAFYRPLTEKARKADPKKADCCYYEVIRETAPCNLYFDLEYSLVNNLNQEKNGDRMVDTLVALCFEVLAPIIGRQPTTAEVVELEATEQGLKFSRHLVIRLLDACFHNFASAGSFVAHIIGKIKERAHLPEYAELWVQTEDQGPVLFIDRGVYTKNRNFRLFRSTKLGKGRPLQPHESRHFYPWTRSKLGESEKELFRASLVSYVSPAQEQVLQWVGPGKDVVPARVSRPSGDLEARPQSPYPGLDAWLLRLVGRWGSPPAIKSVLTSRHAHSLFFNIQGNRYCHRISREHKSNSVYWLADLAQHTVEQHCFDPDCRTFRSNAFPFPPYLLQPQEAISDADLLTLEDWAPT